MNQEKHVWYSNRVGLEMPISVYGYYGLPILLIPTACASYEEAENFGLIQAMSPLIDQGKIKLFSINSINAHAWGNTSLHPGHQSYMTQRYDEYIVEEVVPFIYDHCKGRQPIVNCGASMGAFYASNSFFKHPEIFDGLIGMHGIYNLQLHHPNYWDENFHRNNPSLFLPHLHEQHALNLLQSKNNVYIITSYGMWENPQFSKDFSQILETRNIPHTFHIWDSNWPHDWHSWNTMLPHYIDIITRQ